MTYMQGVIFVSDASKIPTEDHYAIIENQSVHIPGDERSRTHPGHGYPASTENFIRYMAIIKREDLMLYLSKEKPEKRRNLRVLKVQNLPVVESFSLAEQ